MLSCALMDLDACPVEGFQPEKMDELLGLTAQGLTSVVVGVVGHRSANGAFWVRILFDNAS